MTQQIRFKHWFHQSKCVTNVSQYPQLYMTNPKFKSTKIKFSSLSRPYVDCEGDVHIGLRTAFIRYTLSFSWNSWFGSKINILHWDYRFGFIWYFFESLCLSWKGTEEKLQTSENLSSSLEVCLSNRGKTVRDPFLLRTGLETVSIAPRLDTKHPPDQIVLTFTLSTVGCPTCWWTIEI